MYRLHTLLKVYVRIYFIKHIYPENIRVPISTYYYSSTDVARQFRCITCRELYVYNTGVNEITFYNTSYFRLPAATSLGSCTKNIVHPNISIIFSHLYRPAVSNIFDVNSQKLDNIHFYVSQITIIWIRLVLF